MARTSNKFDAADAYLSRVRAMQKIEINKQNRGGAPNLESICEVNQGG